MLFNKIKNILKKANLPVGLLFETALKGGKEDFYNILEETLILSDVGIQTTGKIIKELKRRAKNGIITEELILRTELADILSSILNAGVYPNFQKKPVVIMVSGINGAGKTTSIAKLAHYYSGQGMKILLGACDTFRAAADEQLSVWASRTGCSIFLPEEQKDPAAVAYLAYKKALDENFDMLIIDTAGRMHTNKNLMGEIEKIFSVLRGKFPDINIFSLLVLDSNTGRNALSQTKQFSAAAKTDAIFLTKIDGTAKGGATITIADEMSVPISYIGVGENFDDMWIFNKQDFIKSIIED